MTHYAHIVLTFLFLLSAIHTSSFSQYDDAKFEHITTVDGLPDLIIKCILQDHLGFIWLGTANGLVKYNGYSMKIYRPKPGDSTSISHSVIVSLYEDKHNNLWIGTGWGELGGLNLFDRATETFTRYLHNPNDTTSVNHNFITSIYEDNEGRFWIGTIEGLNLLDKINGKFQHFYFKDSASSDKSKGNVSSLKEGTIYDITENLSNGDLLIGAQFPGLWKLNFNKKHIEKFFVPEGMNKVNNVPITDFYQTDNGIIWMGIRTGLAKFDSKRNEISFYPDPLSPVNEMEYDFNPVLQDHQGMVWKGIFRDGLIQFDPHTEKYKRYKYDKLNSSSLYGENVRSLMEDHSGIIWIGKHWYGLDKYDCKKWKFKNYSNDPGNPNSLSNKFDRQNNQFYHYRHDPDNSFSISSDSIRCITADNLDENILWIGTRSGGLNKFDTRSGIFTHYKNDSPDINNISHTSINTIAIDDKGIIWCGTWGGGLNSFDRNTGKFTHFKHDPNDPKSISQNQIAQIYKDHSGILWISTNTQGINRLDPNTRTFTQYRSLLKEAGSTVTTVMYEDVRGKFWVGTSKSGLHLFDRKKGISIKNFTEKDGLSNNWVVGILEDDSGNLWRRRTWIELFPSG
ncbi:MAG: two-component regulator propeller domain-containing protein [Ignavibacteriaceae bacterium]